ncbi:hypothetical protein JCM19238_4620 [Vibrio ponticus]|nr:hypothetical protein JCM19238_4620 [Vibrio ponticus]
MTASLGISYWTNDDSASLDEMISLADSHMYTAKRLGKNQFYYPQ